MIKKRSLENANNLKNKDEGLFRVIVDYNLNQQLLTSRVFAEEWKATESMEEEEKAKERRKLVGRFRNKLLGYGSLYPNEYSKLQQVLSEIAEDMRKTVDESIYNKTLERKNKIKRLLENLDDESLNELLKDR